MPDVEKLIDEEITGGFSKEETRSLGLAFAEYILMLEDHESLGPDNWEDEDYKMFMGLTRKMQALVRDGREFEQLNKAFEVLSEYSEPPISLTRPN